MGLTSTILTSGPVAVLGPDYEGVYRGAEKAKHEGTNRDVSANSVTLASNIRQNSSE